MARAKDYLSPRAQQIIEIAYRLGRVTASDLEEALPGQPSNSTVRTLLRKLEEKGKLTHIVEEGKFVYLPTDDRAEAGGSALKRVLDTFFEGSVESAVAGLLTVRDQGLSEEEYQSLLALIHEAKEKGR